MSGNRWPNQAALFEITVKHNVIGNGAPRKGTIFTVAPNRLEKFSRT